MMKKVILILIVVICICATLIGIDFKKKTEVREIPGVQDWVSSYDNRETVVRCYLIRNQPTDYDELKKLAEKCIDNNFTKIASSEDENVRYKCFFYRVSHRLPWTWKEVKGGWSADLLEDHTDDMIVAVYWTTDTPEREYYVMEKSRKRKDYGKLLKEVRYKGDVREGG